jgi:starch-binding outer membrane protein, SusD/RagB family
MLAATSAALLLASCSDLDIANTNAPTADDLAGAPSKAVLARAAIGIQTQTSVDLAAQIQQWGIYGREGWNLLGNDPRETGEEVSGPQDPGGRAGGQWAGKYGAIRTINAYIGALGDATDMTEQEKAASRGFANTIKAFHQHMLAVRSGPTGIPVDVDQPIEAEPAPLVASAEASAAASALLDEALTDLAAGGAAFPFNFVEGYAGFTTPATFARFNRALAAKVLVHRATFFACATCWTQAQTAIAASFITEAGLPGSLTTGVYYGYTGAAGEANNPVSEGLTSNRYWVHPSIITGAQLRANGQPDLRLTTKTLRAPTPRSLNGLTGTHKPVMYNSASDPSAANLGANVPWITNEELLLLRAEIRWNVGDRPGAISDINLVRVNAGGLAPTSLTAGSASADFITELLYNRLYSLMWTQGTRWLDARRYNRVGTLPIDRTGDVVHPNMLIPSAECDARRLPVPCSI